MNAKDITHQDMLTFIAGEADGDTKRQIAAEMQVQGSYVNQWIRRMQSGMDDLLNVDWPQLVNVEVREDPSPAPASKDDARKRLFQMQREFLKQYEQGNTKRAREIVEYATIFAHEHLGPDDPDTAMTLGDVGCLLQKEGRHEEAKEYHRRALEIYEQKFSAKHTATARSMCNLGSAYHCSGEHTEARRLYEQALAIWEELLGSEDITVARGLNNLGCLLYTLDEFDESLKRLERAATIFTGKLGPDHQDVAVLRNNLSVLYRVVGRVDEAGREEQAAIIVLKAILPDDDAFFAGTKPAVTFRSPDGYELILLTRMAA